MELNPQVVFERMFGSGGSPEERAARRERDRSILDSLGTKISSLRGDFSVPDQIEFQRINRSSGLLAEASTQDAYFQPFLAGTAPERSFTEKASSEKSERAARDDIF